MKSGFDEFVMGYSERSGTGSDIIGVTQRISTLSIGLFFFGTSLCDTLVLKCYLLLRFAAILLSNMLKSPISK